MRIHNKSGPALSELADRFSQIPFPSAFETLTKLYQKPNHKTLE